MPDADFVVLAADLCEDSEVLLWSELARCPTEPEAMRLAASMRNNSTLYRVLRADDVAAALSPPSDASAEPLGSRTVPPLHRIKRPYSQLARCGQRARMWPCTFFRAGDH